MSNAEKLGRLCDHIAGNILAAGPGFKAHILSVDNCGAVATALARSIIARGGVPVVETENTAVTKAILQDADDDQIAALGREHYRRLDGMDASIVLKGYCNMYAMADMPMDKMIKQHVAFNNLYRLVRDGRKIHRLLLRVPTDHLAQSAGLDFDALHELFYKVCNIDYTRFYEHSKPLEHMMKARPRVRMISQGTDISLTIDSAGVGNGRGNIPDGEIVGTPDPDSVSGVVSFNIPQLYMGFVFKNIRLEVENGIITKATANDCARLNQILDADAGARRFGEWSIGLNPYLRAPMTDILYDEKMTGSIHITPGKSPINDSEIHWDIVQSHLPEFGGGEIYFDGELIRKDGIFVHPDLLELNPEPYARYVEENCRL